MELPVTERLGVGDVGDSLAFVGLIAFAIAAYTSIAIWIPATAVARPALAASLLAAAGVALSAVAGPRRLRLDGLRGALLVAFWVLTAASILWSIAPEASQTAAEDIGKEGLIYLVIVNAVRDPVRLRRTLAVLAGAAAVPAIGCVSNYWRGLDLLGGTRARWVGIFQDPNHLAMALTSAVPLALFFVLEGPGLVRRLVAGAVAAVAVAGVVVTQSRGGAVGLGAAVLAFALLRRQKGRGLVAAFALAAGLLAFAPAAFWRRTETLADYQTDVSALGRIHAWQVLYRVATDRPLSGVGAGAFLAAWPVYAPIEAGQHAFVTHNVFLQPLAELGLPGFLLFLALVSSCLAGAFRVRADTDVGPAAGAVLAALVGNLVCQLSSGYSPNTFLFMLLGLAGAAELMAQRAPRLDAPLFAP
ncbi:MAG TPA: O-antigen ligase family protein [Myxococcales bacterium]|nr:O-antigen ligase family protein [Myxococcales bacterium]